MNTLDVINSENHLAVPDDLPMRLLAEKLVTDRGRRRLLENDIFQCYGPKLVSHRFFLVVLNILDYLPEANSSRLRCSESAGLDEKEVQELFVELLPRQFSSYPFTNGGDMYVLVNLADNEPLDDERINRLSREFVEICVHCQKKLLRMYGVRLQLYISPLIAGLEEMDSRLEDLRHMMYTDMESVVINGDLKDVVTETDLNELMKSSCLRDMEMLSGLEQNFYSAVMMKDFDGAYQTVCQIINIESKSFAASISLKHRLCNKIETIYSLLGVPFFAPDSHVLSVHQALKGMEDSISVDDMKDQMNMVLNDFKSYFTTVVVTPAERMNLIAEYINQHYMDMDLCADKICEVFEISMSYLSRTFKNCVGTKLIDYIHQTKLTAAKRLLRSTDYTVEKVAVSVGYQNVLTFNRAFKRYEATTPGMYRSLSHCAEEGGERLL